MNIEFYNSHIETLADLIKLAEKHNCKIHFGFYSSSERTIDNDIVEKCGLTEELLQEIYDKMTVSDCASSFDKVWFELYDKRNETYNTMTYIESSTYFTVERLSEFDFRFPEDTPSDELIEWLELHDELWGTDDYTINESHNPTIIHGFGNEKRIEDFRCYRSGMAVKFFADLVCDYLDEPRIHRVY